MTGTRIAPFRVEISSKPRLLTGEVASDGVHPRSFVLG
jgi:hypothetical protein